MAESGQQNPGFSSDWSDPTSQPQPFNKLLAPNKYCAPNESYNATPNQVVFAQQQPAADVNAASNQPPNQAPNKYVADSNQAGVFTTQHRHKRLMIVAFVVTGVATLIGMLGLVALLLAVWGLVRKKRGHSGRSLWVAALWVGSILIAIEVAGWAVLAAYLARKAKLEALISSAHSAYATSYSSYTLNCVCDVQTWAQVKICCSSRHSSGSSHSFVTRWATCCAVVHDYDSGDTLLDSAEKC